MRFLNLSLASILALQVAMFTAAEAQQVGVVTAHNTNATSTQANGTRTVVRLGNNVYYNETFTTDTDGRLQARLKDGSSFTLSANTSLTVDSFVYDPDLSSGRILASVTAGVVQFIGGDLSKTEGQVVLDTPTSAVGIRGGIAVIRVSRDTQETEVSFHFGKGLDITLKDGRSFRLTRPGTSLRVGANAAGQIGSVVKGAMSANHLGSIKAMKGKLQNKQLAGQRQAILKQKIIQSGALQSLSGQTGSIGGLATKPRLSKALQRTNRTKRQVGNVRTRKRLMRQRRKLN